MVLFIDMMLSWYGVGGKIGEIASSLGGVDTTVSAWTAFSWTDLLMFLTILATAAWIGGLLTNNHEIARQAKQVVMGLGAGVAVIVLYRIINQPGPNDLIDVKYGAFIGLVALVGIAYGAFSDQE